MSEPKTGFNMNFYQNTGTVGTPVWEEICCIGDLSIPDLNRVWAQLKRRCNKWTKGVASLINMVAVEFRMIYGCDADQFDTMRTDFLAGTVKEYAILDGPIATVGTEGWRMPLGIENFPWDQPLEDVSGQDIRMVLGLLYNGSSEVDPSWMTVSS